MMNLMRSIILTLLMCLPMAALSQNLGSEEQEWYLDEVVSETFVARNYFEYYYMPSASEMQQQRDKGEVSYFLNTPQGLNSKKVRDMIDRLMASYDDIKAVTDWHMTSTTYWKEYRFENNKFRFSVKRKALDDGTYYVSVTESANYFKSLAKNKKSGQQAKQQTKSGGDKPATRSTRRGRRQVVDNEESAAAQGELEALLEGDDESGDGAPVLTEKQRRKQAREEKEAQEMAERARLRRAQEKRREEARAAKEAEKQKKAEEKQKREQEKQLKKQQEKERREQARREREQERREQEASRKQAAAPKSVESKYHYSDVALWLSEKYDFTQTAAGESSCTMYSTAVKDVEMAKLAIKNALKGSNARMAVPWRVNSQTQAIETGYTVDGHVLVFAISTSDDGKISLTVTEVSAEELEEFKGRL